MAMWQQWSEPMATQYSPCHGRLNVSKNTSPDSKLKTEKRWLWGTILNWFCFQKGAFMGNVWHTECVCYTGSPNFKQHLKSKSKQGLQAGPLKFVPIWIFIRSSFSWSRIWFETALKAFRWKKNRKVALRSAGGDRIKALKLSQCHLSYLSNIVRDENLKANSFFWRSEGLPPRGNSDKKFQNLMARTA